MIIDDENTTGMPDTDYGDKENSLPVFDKYMKSNGSSGGDQTRAGSHGIGKAAPLATTPLRTIFVGTMWEEDSTLKTLYQGRARLMYKKFEENGVKKVSSGTGYWGTDDFKPFQEIEDDRFSWLRRKKRGTTIAIPGFRTQADRDWLPIIAGYIASDFFAAIYRGALEVHLDDKTENKNPKLKINKASLGIPKKFFKNQFITEQIIKHTGNESPELNEAHYFYRSITEEPHVQEFNEKLLGKYDVRLRVFIEEGAPRKICFIRENMKITDNLKYGKKLFFWAPGTISKSKIKDFAGVVEILNPKGNSLFRSMEPAQHNALAIDNMPIDDRDDGKKAFTALSKWLREKVEEIASEEALGNRSVSELTEYFYDDSENNPDADSKTREENINGRFVINRKPMKPQVVEKEISVDDDEPSNVGGSGGGSGSGGGGSGGEGPGEGPGGGGIGDKPMGNKTIKILRQRLVKVPKTDSYLVNFTTSKFFTGNIKFVEIGIDGNTSISIGKTEFGEVRPDGTIGVKREDFNDDLKKTFEVVFSKKPKGGLALTASESE